MNHSSCFTALRSDLMLIQCIYYAWLMCYLKGATATVTALKLLMNLIATIQVLGVTRLPGIYHIVGNFLGFNFRFFFFIQE